MYYVTCPSGVSAGHIIPQWELWSCLGFANLPGFQGVRYWWQRNYQKEQMKVDSKSNRKLPSRPIGEFNLRKWERVDANVKRFKTCVNICIQKGMKKEKKMKTKTKKMVRIYIQVISAHLWNSCPGTSSICLSPVPGSKRILKSTCNCFCFNRKLQIDILSTINTLARPQK